MGEREKRGELGRGEKVQGAAPASGGGFCKASLRLLRPGRGLAVRAPAPAPRGIARPTLLSSGRPGERHPACKELPPPKGMGQSGMGVGGGKAGEGWSYSHSTLGPRSVAIPGPKAHNGALQRFCTNAPPSFFLFFFAVGSKTRSGARGQESVLQGEEKRRSGRGGRKGASAPLPGAPSPPPHLRSRLGKQRRGGGDPPPKVHAPLSPPQKKAPDQLHRALLQESNQPPKARDVPVPRLADC